MRADGWSYFTKLNAQTNFLNIVMNTTQIVLIFIDLFRKHEHDDVGQSDLLII